MVQKGELEMAEGVFRGGIPYGPDIRKLDEAFPITALNEGTLVPHTDLEEACGYKRGTSRYYALIRSWTAHQKHQNGVFMRWEQRQGLRVMDPAGLLLHVEKKIGQGMRQTVRAIRVLPWVDRKRLDELGQRRLDHQNRIADGLTAAMNTAKRELAVELAPIKSLPKPKLLRA